MFGPGNLPNGCSAAFRMCIWSATLANSQTFSRPLERMTGLGFCSTTALPRTSWTTLSSQMRLGAWMRPRPPGQPMCCSTTMLCPGERNSSLSGSCCGRNSLRCARNATQRGRSLMCCAIRPRGGAHPACVRSGASSNRGDRLARSVYVHLQLFARDDLAELRDLGLHEAPVLFGCIVVGECADLVDARLRILAREKHPDLAVERIDHRTRRAAGEEDSKPRRYVEAGELGRAFAHSRNIGRERRALGHRGRKGGELSTADLRQRGEQVVEQNFDLTPERCGERRTRAAERNVGHFQTCELQEPRGGQVRALARA